MTSVPKWLVLMNPGRFGRGSFRAGRFGRGSFRPMLVGGTLHT